MSSKHHINKLRLIKNVCAIVQEHYEEGNRSRCYKEVWRKYVYPIYPMCYHTFLSYINTPLGDLRKPPKDDPRQLKLFDK